jgi:hypothetical protein
MKNPFKRLLPTKPVDLSPQTPRERPSYIDALLLEIDYTSPTAFEPIYKIQKNETVIDVMSEYERKVWALQQECSMKTENAIIAAKYSPNVATDHELHKQVDNLHHKNKVLQHLLFALIMDRIEHQCGKGVSVREGWKIVTSPAYKNPFEMFGAEE